MHPILNHIKAPLIFLIAIAFVHCEALAQRFQVVVKTIPDSVHVFSSYHEYEGITPLSFKAKDSPDSTFTLQFYKDEYDTIIHLTKRLTKVDYMNGYVKVYADDLSFTFNLGSIKVPAQNYTLNNKLSIGAIVVDMKQGEIFGSIGSRNFYYDNPEYATSKDFKTIAEEVGEQAGLKIIGGLNLFEDNKEESEYVLGAKVKKIYSHYYEMGAYPKWCKVNVEWQLYDRVRKEVVFTKSIEGLHMNKNKMQVASSAVFEAYRNSIKRLLRDDDFYKVFAGSKPIIDSDKKLPLISITRPSSRVFKDFKTSSSELQNSVVTVKSGINRHGSGFLISSDGYLLTNYHVIEKADTIEIILNSGVTLPAQLISQNEGSDLALLKLFGNGFKPLAIGNSDSTEVGEELIAIGTPVLVELSQSVTKGVLSARREIDGKPYLQADASVSPGNSGGPLINSKGEVVGIITLKAIERGVEGISFAIPINEALKKLNIKLKEKS